MERKVTNPKQSGAFRMRVQLCVPTLIAFFIFVGGCSNQEYSDFLQGMERYRQQRTVYVNPVMPAPPNNMVQIIRGHRDNYWQEQRARQEYLQFQNSYKK